MATESSLKKQKLIPDLQFDMKLGNVHTFQKMIAIVGEIVGSDLTIKYRPGKKEANEPACLKIKQQSTMGDTGVSFQYPTEALIDGEKTEFDLETTTFQKHLKQYEGEDSMRLTKFRNRDYVDITARGEGILWHNTVVFKHVADHTDFRNNEYEYSLDVPLVKLKKILQIVGRK